MKDKVEIKIDGKELIVPSSATILDVANEIGIYIPTLCHNDALKPYASCRMCLVEIYTNGRKRIVTACNYKVENGLEVYTTTKEVEKLRKINIEILLAKAPDSKKIQDLAFKLGVSETRFKKEKGNSCILCGLCARICEEIVGASAINFYDRGNKRKIGPPFGEPSEDCIGCGMCAYVCPTNTIEIIEKDGKRIIEPWGKEVKMKKCEKCGNYFIPQPLANKLEKEFGLKDAFKYCPKCKNGKG